MVVLVAMSLVVLLLLVHMGVGVLWRKLQTKKGQ